MHEFIAGRFFELILPERSTSTGISQCVVPRKAQFLRKGLVINMKKLQFSIEIDASKERVWATLWDDKSFRDWASIIDEGTYMQGEMIEGNEIQFISSVNGYGVTSLIEKLTPNEFILFRHSADTKESGQHQREKEWTGGTESYSLTENNGVTALIVKTDVPQEMEEMFNIRLPQALERIKTLAEEMQ